jgi:LPXTG-motif cell wall-anchored protein
MNPELPGVGDVFADVSEFTLELFDDEGAIVSTVVDTSSTNCDGFFVTDQCGVIENVAPGDYTVGEVPVQGYEGSVSCQTAFPPGEMFAGQTAFTHGATGFPTVCTITNVYRKSEVTITHLVVNDDIGTSGSDDFTAELFSVGSLMIDRLCAADGSCFTELVPIGEYTVGVSGPTGYTHTVVVTVENLPTEQLVAAAAMFTLGSFQTATVVITSDDDPPPPTTTTTTLAPTTLAPTTSVLGAGAGTLPATGPDDRVWNSALIAAVLLALGGATIFATRKRPI